MIALYVIVAVIVILLLLSVRIAAEWQRAVILRLGRLHKVKGPGLYLLLPLIDRATQVIDLRVQTSTISAEQALTRDTVAVGVDAIVFWQVADAAAAAVRIADYRQAIERVAQTSLREMIGASDLARLLSDRRSADEQLRIAIAEKTKDWGMTVLSVEIRDVAIPRELQDAMSRQAQAEREKVARVTLASAELAIAEQVLEAANALRANPAALKLRQMNLLYEMNKERGTTVLIPTDMASSLGGLVGLLRRDHPSRREALHSPGAEQAATSNLWAFLEWLRTGGRSLDRLARTDRLVRSRSGWFRRGAGRIRRAAADPTACPGGCDGGGAAARRSPT